MIDHKILVVDDEPIICTLFDHVLTPQGYRVITAASGEQALKILNGDNIQVMFLDQQMPGMNGLELCRRIRGTSPAAVLLAMTGYTSLMGAKDYREAGFDDLLTKPMPIQSIITAAANAFDEISKRWSITT